VCAHPGCGAIWLVLGSELNEPSQLYVVLSPRTSMPYRGLLGSTQVAPEPADRSRSATGGSRRMIYLRKLRTFMVYVVMYHVVRQILELFLPNLHAANRVRGWVLGRFMQSCGQRVAIASGCTINAPWNLIIEDDVYIAHRC